MSIFLCLATHLRTGRESGGVEEEEGLPLDCQLIVYLSVGGAAAAAEGNDDFHGILFQLPGFSTLPPFSPRRGNDFFNAHSKLETAALSVGSSSFLFKSLFCACVRFP